MPPSQRRVPCVHTRLCGGASRTAACWSTAAGLRRLGTLTRRLSEILSALGVHKRLSDTLADKVSTMAAQQAVLSGPCVHYVLQADVLSQMHHSGYGPLYGMPVRHIFPRQQAFSDTLEVIHRLRRVPHRRRVRGWPIGRRRRRCRRRARVATSLARGGLHGAAGATAAGEPHQRRVPHRRLQLCVQLVGRAPRSSRGPLRVACCGSC